MAWYWILIAVLIIVLCGLVLVVKHLISNDSSNNPSAMMITAGLSLIASAFPGTKEILGAILASCFEVTVEVGTDYVAIVCGFMLIVLGFFYQVSIKERIFVLNMLGMFSQIEISDAKNIKDLSLADFKVKETIIDFVDIFQHGELSSEKNKIIVNKIKNQCKSFKSRSSDFKACFTGMAPIPYTILAGTYLSGGNIKRFFEYKGSERKYIELRKKKFFPKCFPKLKIEYSENIKSDSTEITMALSITRMVQDIDIAQFHTDVLRIGLEEPQNNAIITVDQLEDYCNVIVLELEKAKDKYPNLKRINLAASIPSCVSEQLGEQFMLRSNRLPQIVAWHFMNGHDPKYPFGVVVSDTSTDKYGQLITY